MSECIMFNVLILDGLVQCQGGHHCILFLYLVYFGPFYCTVAYIAQTAYVQSAMTVDLGWSLQAHPVALAQILHMQQRLSHSWCCVSCVKLTREKEAGS